MLQPIGIQLDYILFKGEMFVWVHIDPTLEIIV